MKKVLSVSEIEDLLRELTDWKLHDGKLVREWTCKDFVEAMTFVNRVAALAEAAGHHPDIDIRYNHVLVGLVSHDTGGVTERDSAMARRLSHDYPKELLP